MADAWSGFRRAVREEPVAVQKILAIADQAVSAQRRKMLPAPMDELAWIIENESAWDPTATNAISGATGLIQFMPTTAKSLGTSVGELRGMTREQQYPFVEKYFLRGMTNVQNVGDLYLSTFYPSAANEPDDHVIAAAGGPNPQVWAQNPGLRESPTGPITCGSVRRKGTPRTPLPPTDPIASTPPTSTPPSSEGGGWLLLLAFAYLASRK